MNKKGMLLGVLYLCFSGYLYSSDLIVFSKDRPLQLQVFLESLTKYVTGIDSIRAIVRVTPEYRLGYEMVWEQFPQVIVMEEEGKDFKSTVLRAMERGTSDYVLFAVDDIVVKDFFDAEQCEELMELYDAYGFYLRLGLHLNWCYPTNRAQPLPRYEKVEPGLCRWKIIGSGDWGYPNTVDMTLYRKVDIIGDLQRLPYSNPNTLEGQWAGNTGAIKRRCGLFFELSKVVNLPLNRVQSVFNNRHEQSYSPHELLHLFLTGYTIDLEPLFQVQNPSAHMGYSPEFVVRG